MFVQQTETPRTLISNLISIFALLSRLHHLYHLVYIIKIIYIVNNKLQDPITELKHIYRLYNLYYHFASYY